MSTTNTPEPFKLAVDQTVLDDLDERLRRIRWPDDPDNEDGRFGVTRAYLEEFVSYWLDGYDWRTVEADDQRAPQFPGGDRRSSRPLRARARQRDPTRCHWCSRTAGRGATGTTAR